jgi:hypothetical protein
MSDAASRSRADRLASRPGADRLYMAIVFVYIFFKFSLMTKREPVSSILSIIVSEFTETIKSSSSRSSFWNGRPSL